VVNPGPEAADRTERARNARDRSNGINLPFGIATPSSTARSCFAVQLTRLLSGGQIRGTAADAGGAIEQRDAALRRQGVGMEPEVLVLAQEGLGAAARDVAVGLAFGAGVVEAQPAAIAVGAGLEDEHLDLVVGHADVALREQLPQRPAARLRSVSSRSRRPSQTARSRSLHSCQTAIAARANARKRGTAFSSGRATEPIRATRSTSGKAANASVTASAAIRNWR